MAFKVENFITKRQYETCGNVKGIQIIERTDIDYNHFIQKALDQYCTERLLEKAQCSICHTKTSKFCMNCGTPYCSIKCQKDNWASHSLECVRSSSESFVSVDANSGICRKLEQMERNSRKYLSNDNHNVDINNIIKSSLESLIPAGQKFLSTEDVCQSSDCKQKEEPDAKKSKDKVYYAQRRSGSNKSKENFEESKNENVSKKKKAQNMKDTMTQERMMFSTGQKIKVKCTARYKDLFWVIEERDSEKVKEMEETISKNCDSYPDADVKGGICAIKYNQQWRRCKVLPNPKKLLVKCIDSGTIFCPKYVRCKELPAEIREITPMVFRAEFIDTTPQVSDTEFIYVKVIAVKPDRVYRVKICDDKVNDKTLEIEVENKNADKKVEKKLVKKIEKAKVVEEKIKSEQKTVRHHIGKMRRSVVDALNSTTNGVFLVGDVRDNELLGCLVPDDVEEAACCYKRIRKLFATNSDKINAKYSDDVMILSDDQIGRRGVVQFKSNNSYKVRLVDYGHTVAVSDVYKISKEISDLMELACRVTLPEKTSRRYDHFEVNRGYPFSTVRKLSDGKWLCQFSIDLDSTEVFAAGIVEKVWSHEKPFNKYVDFESGCRVMITCLGKQNDLYVKHDGGIWNEELQKLNLKLNLNPNYPVVDVNSLSNNDLVLAKYENDGLWYRARLLYKSRSANEPSKIVFIDYGNYQHSMPSELRVLPEEAKAVPIFMKKVYLTGDGDKFSPEGTEYLQKLVKEKRKFILTYSGSDISKGVVLTDEDGTQINSLAFRKSEGNGLDDTIGKSLKFECLQEGVVESLVMLYVNPNEFIKNGHFWAANGKSSNVLYVMSELRSLLSEHCEKDQEKYVPKVGDLCIAQYEGDWYRGVATFSFGPLAEILFVDYGNKEVIGAEKMRQMVPKFFGPPAIAVKCVLNDFETYSIADKKQYYSLISSRINTTLENEVVVKKVVENVCYVEFLDLH